MCTSDMVVFVNDNYLTATFHSVFHNIALPFHFDANKNGIVLITCYIFIAICVCAFANVEIRFILHLFKEYMITNAVGG